MNGSGARRIWVIRLAMVVAAALLLARLGPFGTFTELPWLQRYSYWVGLTLLMWMQSLAALALLSTTRARRLREPMLLVLAALAGAVPTAFEVAWAEMLVRVHRDLTLIDVGQIYGDVALLAVPLILATHLLVGRTSAGSAASRGPSENLDWLLSRLRPERRGKLLALKSEDHYVRVHTDRGSELIHMRFGDSIARIAPELGVQVHRSWWVARDAVRSQRRDGDRVLLELTDGSEVPISRSYLLAARNAGLISIG